MPCNAAIPVRNAQVRLAYKGSGINYHENTPAGRLADICIQLDDFIH